MFILSTLADTVAIIPIDFEKRTRQAIEDNINEKYANKVVQEVGLCICFYDLLKASDGHIGGNASDGTVYVNVEFRILAFRPFLSEILEGKITASTPSGVRVSLDFFDDILVPASNMFPNTSYRADENVWVWNGLLDEDGAQGPGEQLFLDVGERVRFKVEGEIWTDQAPVMGRRAEVLAAAAAARAEKEESAREKDAVKGKGPVRKGTLEKEEFKKGKCPWRLVASMQHPGLGCLNWW